MTDYILTYSFEKADENAWKVDYSCVDRKGRVVVEDKNWLYRPIKRTFDTNNELRKALGALFGARKITTWKLKGKMKMICLNPESDFLSRSEMIAHNALRRQNPIIVPEAKPVVAEDAGEALYEVVNKHGVWTIEKHAEPLLTAEQAKTVLFQRIVNGD